MEKATLSFGMQAGVKQYRANFTSVNLNQNNTFIDPAFSQNVDKILFDVGAGLYFNTDKFYLGLSAMDLLRNRFSSYQSANFSLGSRQEVHFFLSGGVVFPLND